jgi:hypothetical protein
MSNTEFHFTVNTVAHIPRESRLAGLNHPVQCSTYRYHVSYSEWGTSFTLSLTAVGSSAHTTLYMQNTLKVLKARYCKKLSIPQALSYACSEITILPNLGPMRK